MPSIPSFHSDSVRRSPSPAPSFRSDKRSLPPTNYSEDDVEVNDLYIPKFRFTIPFPQRLLSPSSEEGYAEEDYVEEDYVEEDETDEEGSIRGFLPSK